MGDLIMKNIAKPGDKAPDLEKMLHMELVNDKFKFTPAELAKVQAYAAQYASVLS